VILMKFVHVVFQLATACRTLLSSTAVAAGVDLRVLSGRADMVTGGDALIETNALLEEFSCVFRAMPISVPR